MKWHKQANNQDSHPDIMAAGFWGGVVFRCICRVSGEFDLDGEIPPKYSTPEFITRRLGLSRDCHVTGDPVEFIREAIGEILSLGLVESSESSGLIIPGWKDLQGDTGAGRQRSLRASRDSHATVTLLSGPEEKRVEESRGEENRDRDNAALALFLKVTGRKFKVIPDSAAARWKEGATLDDLERVLRWLWADRAGTDLEKFIRPSTVFAKSKWSEYVVEATRTPTQTAGPKCRKPVKTGVTVDFGSGPVDEESACALQSEHAGDCDHERRDDE